MSKFTHGLLSLLLWIQVSSSWAQMPVYDGKLDWNPNFGTLTFTSSGTMPAGREEFFWQVPPAVKCVVIDANVTVHGGFRVPFRSADNPLRIIGRNQETSVIFGTDDEAWTTKNKVPDHEKWKYGAVSVLADATVHISNLTSLNPRGYHVSGYANRSLIHLSQCRLVDNRGGNNNNSDGFIGSAGSTISDSFISTGDDAIKIYHDMTIKNVVIKHHRNGAPIQFGWGGENEKAKAVIENLTIEGASPDGRYNMAPFTWEKGDSGSREVSVHGLKVTSTGTLFDEEGQKWVPLGLFELKPHSCVMNFHADHIDSGLLGTGIINTSGKVSLNDKLIK